MRIWKTDEEFCEMFHSPKKRIYQHQNSTKKFHRITQVHILTSHKNCSFLFPIIFRTDNQTRPNGAKS